MAKLNSTIKVDATEIEKALDKGLKSLKKTAKSLEKEELKAIRKELAGIGATLKVMAQLQAAEFTIKHADMIDEEDIEKIKAAMTKVAEED
jgi:hypothetical protein